jgi:hypothetical protein
MAGIIQTYDNGTHWHIRQDGSDVRRSCRIGNTIYVGGGGATGAYVYRSINRGVNWNQCDSPDGFTGSRVNGIAFVTPLIGWCVTSVSDPLHSGDGYSHIYYTEDGGVSWAEQGNPISTVALEDICAVSGSHAWIGATDYVLYTTDGGQWNAIEVDHSVTRVCAYDESYVWYAGFVDIYTDDIIVGRSTDGGLSWNAATLNDDHAGQNQNVYALKFLSQTEGYVGRYKIYRTTNGGSSFNQVTAPFPGSIIQSLNFGVGSAPVEPPVEPTPGTTDKNFGAKIFISSAMDNKDIPATMTVLERPMKTVISNTHIFAMMMRI